MRVADLEGIIDDTGRKLLQSSSPSVRYWLLKDIMHKDREDAALQRTLTECERYPAKLKLLAGISDDGLWPLPTSILKQSGDDILGRTDQTRATLYKNLLSLLHQVTFPGDERLELAIERMYDDQSEEGALKGVMAHGLPQPQYNGYALYILMGFDKHDDRRVRSAIDWLLSVQRPDGGWSMPYMQDVRYLEEYRHLSQDEFTNLMTTEERNRHDPGELGRIPSCQWTTMMALWGLAERVAHRKDRNIKDAADFLVRRFFQKSPHSNFYQSQKNWTTVKYPFYKCSGLATLSILTKLHKGPDDPRMEKPMEWLISKRYRGGFWTESNRPHMERDEWITLAAIEVISRYFEMC